MGKFSQDKHQQANDALINGVVENDKIESLKEVLALLSQTDDGSTKLASVIDARITAALGEEGAITTAISGAITAGIGEGGDIETWADGRYAPKSNG